MLQKEQHEHPVEKITFVTDDPEDKTIFGYVCSEPCTTGHKLYAIKSKKPVSLTTLSTYTDSLAFSLFQSSLLRSLCFLFCV